MAGNDQSRRGGGCPAPGYAGIAHDCSSEILTLVGKGHNGGDALIATKRFCVPFQPQERILPLADGMNAGRSPRGLGKLNELAEKRIQVIDPKENAVQELEKAVEEKEFSALVDGFLGMQAKLLCGIRCRKFFNGLINARKWRFGQQLISPIG